MPLEFPELALGSIDLLYIYIPPLVMIITNRRILSSFGNKEVCLDN